MTDPWDIIHKAEPSELNADRCAVCGYLIKQVPGGRGPVWVHSGSGTVAAPNPPARQSPDEVRRAMVESGQQAADLAASQGTCDWCGEELHEFEGRLLTDREAGLICRSGPGGGEYPAHHAGGWLPADLGETFTVAGFAAPFVVVIRRSDNQQGTLEFTHSPRRYFSWKADES
jgi:hypothetical protein